MAKLVVEEGSQKGAVYNFRARKAIVVGRGDDVDFVTKDSHASRRHFTIEKRKDSFYIRDLGSTNGTFLNDTPVKSERLKSGGKIRVGQTIFAFLDEDEEDPLLGQNVGGYLIHARVGKGGMGTVYMASQLSMDRVVALKILSERLVQRKDFVSRFISEARAAGRLNHPNIVQVHDVGKADKIYYYSMEFMKGGSIQDMLLRAKKMSFEEAIPLIIDAARGLEFAESRRMVHRDIKPDNLMLADDKAVKICDLGLAEMFSKGEQDDVKREIMGSPHYMSPEQASGEPLDHRSDIYSLGATFYRMLAGRTPFSGKTPKQIIQKQIAEKPESLKEFGVPRAVAQIVEKMMEKDPGRRHSSATEVVSDLEKLRSMPKPMTISRERVAKRRFRSARRKKGVPFLMAAVALAFIAALVYLLVYLFVLNPEATITVGDAGDGAATVDPGELLGKGNQAAEARAALARAEAYRQAHPGEWDGIIAGYRNVASRFSGTEMALLAERTAKQVEKEREEADHSSAAKKDFLDAVKQSNELVSLRRYGDAIKTLSAVAAKYPNTSWGRNAKARAGQLAADAERAYQATAQTAESRIEDGRHDDARALYRTVISEYGIPAIVEDARNRIGKIGGRIAAQSLKKAENAIRRADGLFKARAFSEALAELRNVSLEGLAEDFSARIRRGQREAGQLNVLKQKLIAAVNGRAMTGQSVTIEKGLRGKLVSADEAAITIELPEGETDKPWEEVDIALICNIAVRSNLAPEDSLALGILCLKEGQLKIALGYLTRAAESGDLAAACRPYILEAERGVSKTMVEDTARAYDQILALHRAGEFNDAERKARAFIRKNPGFSPKEGPSPKELIEEYETKKKEASAAKGAFDRVTRFHKIAKAQIYARLGQATKNARRYHYSKDLEEARVVARLQNFARSASMLQRIAKKQKDKNPAVACEAACEMATVLVRWGRDAATWVRRAEALEQKLEEPRGLADRAKRWVEGYPRVRQALLEALEEQKAAPLAPDVQWRIIRAYEAAGLSLDCLAAVIRMEKDFAEDSHVKDGDTAWYRAQRYNELWLSDEALEAVDELMEDHPEHQSVTRGDAEFMMADIYWYKREHRKAAKMYEDILTEHNDISEWRDRMARRRIAQAFGN